eukprot:1465229-Rhodomonas_salina.1
MAPPDVPLPEAAAAAGAVSSPPEPPVSPDSSPPPELTEGRRQFLLLLGVLQKDLRAKVFNRLWSESLKAMLVQLGEGAFDRRLRSQNAPPGAGARIRHARHMHTKTEHWMRTTATRTRRWKAWAATVVEKVLEVGEWVHYLPRSPEVAKGNAAGQDMAVPVSVAHLNCGHASPHDVLDRVCQRLGEDDIDVLHLQELWLTRSTALSFRNLVAELLPHHHLCLDHVRTARVQDQTLAIATLLRKDVARYTTRVSPSLAVTEGPLLPDTLLRGSLLIFRARPPGQKRAVYLLNVYLPTVKG